MEAKLFSLEEATALLPVLRPLVGDIRQAIEAMREAEAQVSVLVQQHKEAGIDQAANPDRARYWGFIRHARECEERVQNLLDEVRFLGAEVKDFELGLVDFRHQRGGEVVYLCWRPDEDAITHWHGLREGFTGRKPLAELQQHRS